MEDEAKASEDNAGYCMSEPDAEHRGNADRGKPREGVFMDIDRIKEELRTQMQETPHRTSHFYAREGICQRIARSERFERATLLTITANALWISVDTDLNSASVLSEALPIFQVMENLFCTYFVAELLIRFVAFRRKRDCFRDAWFVFDSFMVLLMVLETWVMSLFLFFFSKGDNNPNLGQAGLLRLLRLLRLTKMFRMARIVRALPELMILIKAMVAALRSVVFTLGLLGVMLYIFGIAFTQLCKETPCQEVFINVPTSMNTLLVRGALMDDLNGIVELFTQQNVFLLFLLYMFILVASLTMMNMLIGVICEVVAATAKVEQESLTLGYVQEKMKELMANNSVDVNGDGLISRQEFMGLVLNPATGSILREVGVDVVGLVECADTIFDEDETNERRLDMAEFTNIVLDLRGTNFAMVRDMLDLRKYIKKQLGQLEERIKGTDAYTPASKEARRRTRRVLNDEMDLLAGKLGSHEEDPEEDDIPGCIPEHPEGTPEHHGGGTSQACPAQRPKAGPPFQQLAGAMLEQLLQAHGLELSTLQAENRRLQEELVKFTRVADATCPLCTKHAKPGSEDQADAHSPRLTPKSCVSRQGAGGKGHNAECNSKVLPGVQNGTGQTKAAEATAKVIRTRSEADARAGPQADPEADHEDLASPCGNGRQHGLRSPRSSGRAFSQSPVIVRGLPAPPAASAVPLRDVTGTPGAGSGRSRAECESLRSATYYL